MAYTNKTIYNPAIGQSIRFIQTSKDTGGSLLEMVATYRPHSKRPAPHYHPLQEEEFTVISGSMNIDTNGNIITLKKGETLHIQRNTKHAMWNGSDSETVVQWKVRPALNTEHLLETLSGLAMDGKTNNAGVPSLLQVALIAPRFSGAFRLAKPSFIAQQVVFFLLAPFAYLLGYKPVYKKYID